MQIVKLEKVNWLVEISEVSPLGQVRSLLGNLLSARVRYRQTLQTCHIKEVNRQSLIVVFDKPQTIASGQSLVLYDKEICLGGGVIV